MNFTPVVRHGYRIGVTTPGSWREILNTDAIEHGGGGQGNAGAIEATAGRARTIAVTLPPLGAVYLKAI